MIHDRYRQRLLAYTRQMLPASGCDAEDALQDVFVRAYRGLRVNDRDLSLRPWLYRIARNRCVDELRRPAPPVASELLDMTRGPEPDPVAETERRETMRRLMTDVRRLPEQQRSALLLRELGGLSYDSVASVLEVSTPAVKSLLVRARLGLAQSIEARDTACSEIRHELARAHDRGVRPSGMARRHLRDCPGCRQYRSELRSLSRQLAALVPAAGPLAGLTNLLGIGGGGGAAGSGATASGTAFAGGAASAGGALVSTGVLAAGATHAAALLAAAVLAAGGAVELQQTASSKPPPKPVHRAAAAPTPSAPHHPIAPLSRPASPTPPRPAVRPAPTATVPVTVVRSPVSQNADAPIRPPSASPPQPSPSSSTSPSTTSAASSTAATSSNDSSTTGSECPNGAPSLDWVNSPCSEAETPPSALAASSTGSTESPTASSTTAPSSSDTTHLDWIPSSGSDGSGS